MISRCWSAKRSRAIQRASVHSPSSRSSAADRPAGIREARAALKPDRRAHAARDHRRRGYGRPAHRRADPAPPRSRRRHGIRRVHQASPNAPRARARKTGQRQRPRPTGRPVSVVVTTPRGPRRHGEATVRLGLDAAHGTEVRHEAQDRRPHRAPAEREFELRGRALRARVSHRARQPRCRGCAAAESLEREAEHEERGRQQPEPAERRLGCPQTDDRDQHGQREQEQRAAGQAHRRRNSARHRHLFEQALTTAAADSPSSAASGVSTSRWRSRPARRTSRRPASRTPPRARRLRCARPR